MYVGCLGIRGGTDSTMLGRSIPQQNEYELAPFAKDKLFDDKKAQAPLPTIVQNPLIEDNSTSYCVGKFQMRK